MFCPLCGHKLRLGVVEHGDEHSLLNSYNAVRWFPEEEENKLIKTNVIRLRKNNRGYYCSKCENVYLAYKVD